MSELSSFWFTEVKKLDVGQALFIRVADKKEQTRVANEFEEEREKYSELEPVHASQIFINKVLKDRKQYVVLERKYRAPFTAFLRDKEGVFSKITIDPERKRMISLMIKDRKERSEVEEILGGLTEDEVSEFYPEKQFT